jgi:Outer membrane protein beta-barrel domain
MSRNIHRLGCGLLLAVLACGSGAAMAQTYYSSYGGTGTGRTGTWEFYADFRFLFGDTLNFNGGTQLRTNDDVGFGIGGGFNLNEHINLGFEWSYNNVTYNGTIASGSGQAAFPITGSASISRLAFTGAYNLLEGPLTPYVGGNLGYSYIDTNIPNGPPQTGCWWDPWFGYICSTWQSTHGTNAWIYGLDVGLRWDANRAFFIRGGYEYNWASYSQGGTQGAGLITLQIGARY